MPGKRKTVTKTTKLKKSALKRARVDLLDDSDSEDGFEINKEDSGAEEEYGPLERDDEISGDLIEDEERSTDGSDRGSDLDDWLADDDEIEYASDYDSDLECTGFSTSEDERECREFLRKSKAKTKTKNSPKAAKKKAAAKKTPAKKATKAPAPKARKTSSKKTPVAKKSKTAKAFAEKLLQEA